LPGVRSVSLSHSTLIGGGGNWQMLHIGGYVPKSGEEVGAAVNWIGQNFFETLGIPVVLGRSVTEGDTESAPKVVVVNERFVRQCLGAGNPIGRRIGLGNKGDSTPDRIPSAEELADKPIGRRIALVAQTDSTPDRIPSAEELGIRSGVESVWATRAVKTSKLWAWSPIPSTSISARTHRRRSICLGSSTRTVR